MLTQERLKELLDYDPDTGAFIRLASRGNTIKGSNELHNLGERNARRTD